MNRIMHMVFFLLLVRSATSQNSDSLSFISLKPSAFQEEMSIVSNPVLVDVREFFEFKKTRIPGALNMPSSGNIENTADTIENATHIFLYCTSGFRSRKVADKLTRMGFIHVYSLDGGISDWRKEGLPVERKKVRRQ